MKFNTQLKDALTTLIPHAPRPVEPKELPTIPFYNPGAKKQTVVGGDILRTPIDRTAALVVAKAPWWAKPPLNFEPISPITPIQTPTPKRKPKNRKERRMASPQVAKINHPAQTVGLIEGIDKSNDQINAELAIEVARRGEKSIIEADALVAKALDARAALDVMCDSWKKSWVDFITESDERLNWLRQTRMSFDSETRQLMVSLREVRQFFLDKNHDQEVARLKEFVDLCERLKTLKESGFLDTVADTLLKLV